MSKKPKLFIGSSSEGRPVAQIAFELLYQEAEITLWDHDVFALTDTAIESLLRATQNFDFALLILSADDLIQSRGNLSSSPRDNLIFELGLFIGALGRRRALMLRPANQELKLPSDLTGVMAAVYDDSRFETDPKSSLGVACGQIGRHIQKEQARVSGEKPKNIAAVCIRAEDGNILLVRTTAGRWSFPKGTVFSGETVENAVLRIARVKAGLSEAKFKRELTEYSDVSNLRAVKITPFLVEASSDLASPTEDFRKPQWCSVEDALKRLSFGRPHQNIAELRDILKAARYGK